MGWMVAYTKVLLDQYRHAAPGPDITQEAVRFSALGEQFNQRCELVRAQAWRATRCGMIKQVNGAAIGSASQPLADRTLSHTQSRCDSALGPALLMEFPGALATALAPTARTVWICCAHNPQQSTSRPTSIRSLCSYL